MAVITHPCTKCKHADLWQDRGRCNCGCNCTPGKPEVRPTYDQAGRPVEGITTPGESVGPIKTHRCKACTALYEELTGAGVG